MAALPAQHPCGFCGERKRWPSACPGDPVDEFCLGEIEFRHDVLDDHRQCSPLDCDEYARIAEVASRGQAAARKAGKPFAVVNTLTTPWEFKTFDRLQQAKPYRSRLGRAALGQDVATIAFKVLVFVVRDDGTVV